MNRSETLTGMGHFAEVRFTKMRLLLSLRFQTDPIIVLPGTIPNLSDFPTNQELVHNAVSRVRFKSPENADFGHLWAIPNRAR